MTPPEAPALIRSWLERLQALDLAGLVELYDPQAELRALHETWHGRTEIADGLACARRWMRGLRIDRVESLGFDGKQFLFDTTVSGKMGRARIRHRLLVHNDRIRDHSLFLVDHEKVPVATA